MGGSGEAAPGSARGRAGVCQQAHCPGEWGVRVGQRGSAASSWGLLNTPPGGRGPDMPSCQGPPAEPHLGTCKGGWRMGRCVECPGPHSGRRPSSSLRGGAWLLGTPGDSSEAQGGKPGALVSGGHAGHVRRRAPAKGHGKASPDPAPGSACSIKALPNVS